MTALSTMFPDVGSLTGSYISVPMIGSRNSSGASATSSSSSCWALPMACNTHLYFINKSQTFDLKKVYQFKIFKQFCNIALFIYPAQMCGETCTHYSNQVSVVSLQSVYICAYSNQWSVHLRAHNSADSEMGRTKIWWVHLHFMTIMCTKCCSNL